MAGKDSDKADAAGQLEGQTVGSYRVLERLASGGMADVWRVRHLEQGTEHALKVLHQTSAEMKARLLEEGRIQSRLRHPNLLRVTELVPVPGGTGLVMALVRGPTLRELLSRERLELEQALSLGQGILAGVAHAHSQGLIHRDLKPDNVLLEPLDGPTRGWTPRVGDFGLARALHSTDERRTRTGLAMGTPGYMAPEQYRDISGVDARADIFALGCILYELLCGRPTFERGDVIALYQRALRMDFVDPHELAVPELPRALGALLVQSLRPRPADRPADAGALAERWRLAASGAALEPEVRPQGASLPTLDLDGLDAAAALDGPAGSDEPEAPARHNLPPSPDAFFGRADEQAALSALLSDGERLVTLLGPGGVGKTRFSREFGRKRVRSWPGGVWFCDLSEAVDVEGICAAVARAVELPLTRGDPAARLGAALAGRGRCLMVLDNFEQVAEHAQATAGRWLADASELQILVTSRTLLGLAGERALTLPPLAEDAALALFVERARSRKADYTLSGPEEAAARELARLLDCLPLAIELAAARVQVMSPSMMVARMGQRFRLLSGGRKGRRQAAMRDVIDWSWNLLEGWEQAAFAQCSVFEGGFTLEAAEAALDLSVDYWPMDAVQSLVDKSLLYPMPPNAAGEPRFGMYLSLQEYAAEKLGRGERFQAIAARHAEYFSAFGRPATLEAMHVHGGVVRMVALSDELDNLASAARRAADAGAGVIAARCALAAEALYNQAGPLAASAALLERVLEVAPVEERLVLLLALSRGYMGLGRRDESEQLLEEVLEAALAGREPLCEADARVGLSQIKRALGEREMALKHLEWARTLYGYLGARRLEADTMAAEGTLNAELGRLVEGKALTAAALPIHRAVGNRRGEGLVLGNQALFHVFAGETDAGLQKMKQALAIYRECRDRSGEAHILGNLSALHQHTGRVGEALRAGQEALALYRELGNRASQAFLMNALGTCYASQGRNEWARDILEEALAIALQLEDRELRSQIQNHLSDAVEALGDRERALALAAESLSLARKVQRPKEVAASLLRLGRLESSPEDARACLEEALAVALGLEDKHLECDVLAALGRLALRTSEPAAALPKLEQALSIARTVGLMPQEVATLSSLGDAHEALGDEVSARRCRRDAASVRDTLG